MENINVTRLRNSVKIPFAFEHINEHLAESRSPTDRDLILWLAHRVAELEDFIHGHEVGMPNRDVRVGGIVTEIYERIACVNERIDNLNLPETDPDATL